MLELEFNCMSFRYVGYGTRPQGRCEGGIECSKGHFLKRQVVIQPHAQGW